MSISWVVLIGVHALGTTFVLAATGYACAAACAVWWAARARPSASPAPVQDGDAAVSILKPLHGAEPNLYENLRGFCQQDHPDYQLIFGVRDPDDAAIAIVQRLRDDFPQRSLLLVIDPRVHGSNLKISNLINMWPHAAHARIVLADSDISVAPDYLRRVTAPLADPQVGIVTCLYRGVGTGAFWSRMGCGFINDWFAPSVRLSHAFGSTRFAFGATIALRRDSLCAIGGFDALRDTLADDFWLGELTRQRGLRTVLSEVLVGTDVHEALFGTLWAHELRWLRTIRSIAPWGFVPACIGFTSPLLLLGLCLAPSVPLAALSLLGAAARALLHFLQRRADPLASSTWDEWLLIPLRDGLLLLEWAAALTGWQVRWHDQIFHALDKRSAP